MFATGNCCAAVRRRERAIELLREIFMGQVPLCTIDADDVEMHAHILRRLRRLCTVPDSAHLADVAKQALKEAFTFRVEPPAWKRVICGGTVSIGASIAGLWSRYSCDSNVLLRQSALGLSAALNAEFACCRRGC